MWPFIDRVHTLVSEHRIFVSIGVGVVACLVILSYALNSETLSESERLTLASTAREDDWVRGDIRGAKAVLVEYSDFECPACAAHYDALTQIKADTGSDIALIYRHFPLSAIHPHATRAALAAEAAGIQGKFFEMHDQLFMNQQEWSRSDDPTEFFLSYARTIGLNEESFKRDLDSKEISDRVAEAEQFARDIKIKGTPTFFLNGEEIPPQRTLAEFKTALLSRIYKGQ